MTGKPFLNQRPGVMRRLGSFSFLARRSEIVTMNTFAVEPIWVPLPPIPTPMARPHHNGVTLMPTVSMLRMMGIMAAVKGMLSMAADMMAPTHIRMMVATSRSCCTNGVI